MPAQSWWMSAPMIGGWVLAAAGMVLLLWAMFWDRSRGRRRCPKCWYYMAGVPGLRCPECGRETRSERAMRKTRRRWSNTFVAVLLIAVGIQAARFGGPGRKGPIAALPTLAMILLVDDYDSREPLAQALVERLRYGWVARGIAGSPRIESCDLDRSTGRRACGSRHKWPVGEPIRIRLLWPQTVGSSFEWQSVTARCALRPGEKATLHMYPPHIHAFITQLPRDWIDLPPPQLGPNTHVINIEVAGSSGASVRGQVRLSVEGVASVSDAIEAEGDPVVTDDLRRHLQWTARLEEDEVRFWVGPGWQWIPTRRDVAYAYQVELLRDAVPMIESIVDGGWLCRSAYFKLPSDVVSTSSIDPRRWYVRVSSLPKVALIETQAPKHWSGAFTLPLSEISLSIEESLFDVSSLTEIPLDATKQKQLMRSWPSARPPTIGTPAQPAK